MPATPTPAELIHRLLFQALVEIRAEGDAQNNKLVYHLADLFHTTALDLLSAAEGETGYDEVLRRLAEKADEIGCGRWLAAAERVAARGVVPTSAAASS